MVVTFKAIQPELYDVRAYYSELKKAANQIGFGMLRDFQKTTRGWETVVEFYIRATVTQSIAEVTVGTDNEIYGYVEKGTRPHVISPVRAKVLRFQSGYRPATTPGRLRSRTARHSGDLVFARRVQHPGTEARNFSQIVADRWEAKAAKLWLQAFRNASRV